MTVLTKSIAFLCLTQIIYLIGYVDRSNSKFNTRLLGFFSFQAGRRLTALANRSW